MKPCYSALAFNIILPKEHKNFVFKQHSYSYLYVGNNKNFNIEHNFDQSLEMRFSGIKLYLSFNNDMRFTACRKDITGCVRITGKNQDFSIGKITIFPGNANTPIDDSIRYFSVLLS